MNSRPSSLDDSTPLSRHSTRSRYSISPPSSAFLEHDFGSNDMARLQTHVAKGGINGSHCDDVSIKRAAAAVNNDELDPSHSTPTPMRDRPWRLSDRWAQYETEDLSEQAQRATSHAVNQVATRMADKAARDYDGQTDEGATTVNGEVAETAEFSYRNDPIRSQAIQMLRIADRLDKSPVENKNNTVTALFRTAGGGLAMRELEDHDSSFRRKGQLVSSSIAGLDKFHNTCAADVSAGSARVQSVLDSQDEDDPQSQHSANEEYGEEGGSIYATASSSWSSRYSVERQLMAITGGLDSTHILNKMDVLHSHREKTKSARGMYRSSASAMDGSGEDYGDYTQSFRTTEGGLGGMWRYIRGTLWSDLMEVNYDGTTQSLVRREKRRQKRKRILMAVLFLMGLIVTVAYLVAKGNPRSSLTNQSIAAGSDSTVNFYVLADEPYDLSNVRQLTVELENLPSDAEFLVHLGNVNSDTQSQCQEYGYERAANILKESPVPTFVIPGDQDWVTCEHPFLAFQWWTQNLGKFDKNFKDATKLNVSYQEGTEENFAFLYRGVLFLSVHIVDAEIDAKEWNSRHERNVMWTKEKLSQYSSSTSNSAENGDIYHTIVIFGHAAPSSKQGQYFWPVITQLKDISVPVLYLHDSAEGGEFKLYRPFGEAENFVAVQLGNQGAEGPMKVAILGNKGPTSDPFEFTRRERISESLGLNE